jgi:hypothetical protein
MPAWAPSTVKKDAKTSAKNAGTLEVGCSMAYVPEEKRARPASVLAAANRDNGRGELSRP